MAVNTPAAKGRYKGQIEERMTVASPPSLALHEIVSFFRQAGNVLELEGTLVVSYKPRPNRSFIGRHFDRIELEWISKGRPQLSDFQGEITILPLAGNTELVLRGTYDPPLGSFGAAYDAWNGQRLASATAHALLEQLRAALEANYAKVVGIPN